MIAFDFIYYKPASIKEAVTIYQELLSLNKNVFYYGGGTEFISRARRNEIKADAIIDLKGIPECNELKFDKDKVIIGATATLTDVIQANIFPLLTDVLRLVATNTERNKITIGGNLLSHLIYREAMLPFLLADSQVIIAGKNGTKATPINNLLSGSKRLKKDEFIIQIITDDTFLNEPYYNVRRTKQSKINYPIVSLAAIQVNDDTRVAFSGVCSYPFRINEIETELNNSANPLEFRIQEAIKKIPKPIVDDFQASVAYRKFVLENTLTELLTNIGRVS